MAAQIQVAGLVTIKIASPASGALAVLGYSLNGVEVTEDILTENVYGDANGGEGGPPIDVQYLGEIHTVRMTLTKWDSAELALLQAGLAGGTAGTPGTSGTLYFQGTSSFRLLLVSTNFTRNYTNVIFTQPKELNEGTKHSKAILVATCHKDSNGVMWNTTIV